MTSPAAHISVSHEGDVLILRYVTSRIDRYDMAEQIGLELITAVKKENAEKVVVDLSNVDFMSSVGYGPLVSLRSYIRRDKGRMALCNLKPMIKLMFEETRLLINPSSPKSLFDHADSLAGAIEIVSNPK